VPFIAGSGNYPSKISGFRFLRTRELMPPVAILWDFQVTEEFQPDSARRLLTELPEDHELSYFDPDAGPEEAWIFVRRVGHRFYIQKVSRGSSRDWAETSVSAVIDSFVTSASVQKPSDSFDSFTVSPIPDHQRSDHLKDRT